jgi:hypothetical protein
MFKHMSAVPALLVPAGAFLVLTAASGGKSDEPEEEVELDEAEVFIEWNSTDGDYGIQFFWDGDGWDRMRVENSEGKTCLQVRARDNLQEQGLTEGFFESVEPDPSELSLEEFLERFPEGEYEFEGKTLEGEVIEGETEFTHVIPSPPSNLFPAAGAEVNAGALVVSCDAVTTDIEGNPLEPELYELVVENTDDETFSFTVVLEGDLANPSVTVPPEFLKPGGNYKLEVIVQEESSNRSITETKFTTR